MKKETNKIPIKKEQSRMGRGPSKTFQLNGHWIEKTQKTAILVCECGNKYIKTRALQTRCLRCMAYISSSR